MRTFWVSVCILMLSTLVFNCSSDDGGESESDETSDNGDGGDDISGPGSLNIAEGLNTTIPKDLAVTSPTVQATSQQIAAGNIQISSGLNLQGDAGGTGYLALVENLKKVLAATSLEDCAAAVPQEFSLAQGGLGHARCFGPSVSYTNHPDGISDGSIGNGDLGIWFPFAEPEEESGEACSSSVVNNLMQNVGSYANAAVGLQALTACAAKLGERDLPVADESIDVTSDLSELDTESNSFAISEALIVNAGDDADGNPIYETKLKGWIEDKPRNIKKDFQLIVKHVPENEENSAYKGRIKMILDDFESGRDLGISIAYVWGDKEIKYRYRQQQQDEVTFDEFDATSEELTVSDNAGLTEVVVNMDNNGFGKIAYTWATFDLLVFNAETKDDGTGVAFFGHQNLSDTTAGTADFSTIKGLRCLPINPPPAGTTAYSDFVQRQTLTLDTDSKVWVPETSNVTFAPTSDCSWNAENNDSSSFTVSLETQEGNVDQEVAFPTDANLHGFDDYKTEWVSPEAPAAL